MTASEWRYCLRVARVTASGTVWSLPPVMSSSGPRFSFSVATFAGECGSKFAEAASKSGRPGAGMVQCSKSSSDSFSETALANANRNCSAVSETARCRLAGFLNTGSVARSADSGTGSTPLIWAASMATAATPSPRPSSFWAIIPPNECPTRMGAAGRVAMIDAKCSVTSSMPWSPICSALAREASTVSLSPGQPGASGS